MIAPESAAEPSGPRYAVYFAPPRDDALHRFGSRWLGRDAESGAVVDQPSVPGMAPGRLAEITEFPRRYGFHATLKAPFRLAAGADETRLAAAVGAIVATRTGFAAPPLRLAALGDWRALVLSEPSTEMQALCDELVAGLDALRAPPTAAETRGRLAGGLSPRERALFERWGYPHVFDRFRFHMTLTSPLGAAEGAAVDAALGPLVARFAGAPLQVDAVALFVQPGPDDPFFLRRRIPFGPSWPLAPSEQPAAAP